MSRISHRAFLFGLAACLLLGCVGLAATPTGLAAGKAATPDNKTIVFVAADSRNGGIVAAYRAFQEASRLLGWRVRMVDGTGSAAGQANALNSAIHGGADGIIIGGFDPEPVLDSLAWHNAPPVPLVGWHASTGDSHDMRLFTDVGSAPGSVAEVAVRFLVQQAEKVGRQAGVVVFTDSQFAVARAKTAQISAALAKCTAAHQCQLLDIVDLPISRAGTALPGEVERLNARYGRSWTYTLAINDVYFDHMSHILARIGRSDIRNISAGDGSPTALSRIASGLSPQIATVAEPFKEQGYQLADEMYRALSHQPPSGYRTRPVLLNASTAPGSENYSDRLDFVRKYKRAWHIATPLHLVTESNPPFNMLMNGSITGIASDKLREILARNQVAYRIELLPWKRAFEMAAQHDNTCVYSTARRPEREGRFKWVGPLAYDYWVFFGLRDHNYLLTNLDDARAYKVGTYNGDVRDSFLRANGFSTEAAMEDKLNPRKLLAGRIALWASSRTRGNEILRESGLSEAISEQLTFSKAALYLACNPQVDDYLISQLGETLEKMNQDGSAADIEKRYVK
ncbi:substrate-binding domain-containing protein [Chitinimonas sp.]|uniref:substrate-binding domain-containing protein n=1 Tax=Chitinimonas sp. TaxID=1934313 RepID=UPI0035B19806